MVLNYVEEGIRDNFTKSFYYLENCEDLRALVLHFFCNMRAHLPPSMFEEDCEV
jgi:hypothetical protein